MSGQVEVQRAGGRVTVTLDHPGHKNSMTPEMWAQLVDVLRRIAEDPGDRVVVLTGAGQDFCSGADLSALAGDDPFIRRMAPVSHACQALHDLPQPTIARLRGVAVGAGANLALGCDLVVAASDVRFSEIFTRVGLSIDAGGSWLLPRAVGLHRAKELALLAGMVDANRCYQLGLVNRVVEADQLDAAVDEWADQLANGPAIALAATKGLLNRGVHTDLATALSAEAAAQAVNVATDDMTEALLAHQERRPPHFRGR
jgi:enoyl-CoA hydratase/carnithine racemase